MSNSFMYREQIDPFLICRFEHVLRVDLGLCYVMVLVCAMCSFEAQASFVRSEHTSLCSVGRERRGRHMIKSVHEIINNPHISIQISLHTLRYEDMEIQRCRDVRIEVERESERQSEREGDKGR